MICRKCNAENPANVVFCGNCGARMADAVPQPAPKAVPVQPVAAKPVSSAAQIPSEYKPLSAWGYFGLNILYCIPIVGFIFLIIHTFSGSNINRRSYARSYWCALLVGTILGIICAIIGLIIAAVTGVAIADVVSSMY